MGLHRVAPGGAASAGGDARGKVCPRCRWSWAGVVTVVTWVVPWKELVITRIDLRARAPSLAERLERPYGRRGGCVMGRLSWHAESLGSGRWKIALAGGQGRWRLGARCEGNGGRGRREGRLPGGRGARVGCRHGAGRARRADGGLGCTMVLWKAGCIVGTYWSQVTLILLQSARAAGTQTAACARFPCSRT